MKLQNIILDFAYKNKELLLKFVPLKWLREVKLFLVKGNLEKMKKIQIKNFLETKYPLGINIIGSIKAETGLGESCRLLTNAVSESDYLFTIFNYSQVGQMRETDHTWDEKIGLSCEYSINIIHINPNEFGIAALQLDSSNWDYRYNIGFWLWEFEESSDEWLNCASILNEIWTPSDFITNSLKRKFNIPIKTLPYPIEVKVDKTYNRKFFGLPEDKFLFLMMYDKNSVSDRKNPVGVIEAFKKAFSANQDDVGLVIKIATSDEDEINKIKSHLGNYKNIYFIVDMLEKIQVNSLINSVDVIMSLHRAEGFGLVLAEAMYLGKPTIATNWSSNTEFMNKENSCLVNYELIELEHDNGPFKKGWKWAEPDTNDAAQYMKKLFSDSDFYEKLSSMAQNDIRSKLCIDNAKEKINQYIQEILNRNE